MCAAENAAEYLGLEELRLQRDKDILMRRGQENGCQRSVLLHFLDWRQPVEQLPRSSSDLRQTLPP